jgi:multidrug efflux system membrane fusion protein
VGTPVRIELVLGSCRQCLSVPAGAIVREGEEAFVYLVNAKGLAERRTVEVGLSSSETVEIRKGLVEGDRIIVEGHEGLPEGAAVAVSKAIPAETEK